MRLLYGAYPIPRSAGNCITESEEIVGISMINCCVVPMVTDGMNCTMMKLFSDGIVIVELNCRKLKLGPYV
jgi:hypothetical protein